MQCSFFPADQEDRMLMLLSLTAVAAKPEEYAWIRSHESYKNIPNNIQIDNSIMRMKRNEPKAERFIDEIFRENCQNIHHYDIFY